MIGLEVRVVRAIRHRELQIVVVALGAVEPVLLVRVAPVLDRVDDRVADALVEPQGQQEPVDAIGRRGVDVEAGLLVGDAIRVLTGAQLGLLALEPRQRAPVGGVEREQAVVVFDHERGVGHDLADRLLEGRLGQVAADDPVLVGADRRGLEPHRVRELGADDRDQRQDQQDDQQREPALAGPCPSARVDAPTPAHGSEPARSDTVMGGSVSPRPPIVPPTLIRMARGSFLVASASHALCHAPLSSR